MPLWLSLVAANGRAVILLASLSVLGGFTSPAVCQDLSEGPARRLETGTILSPVLKDRARLGRWRSGSSVEAELTGPVYSWDREILPSGTRVQLVVDQIRKKPEPRTFFQTLKRVLTVNWRVKSSYEVSFRSANLLLPGGPVVPVALSFIAALEQTRVRPKGDVLQVGEDEAKKRLSTKLILQVEEPASLPPLPLPQNPQRASARASEPVVLPAGTRARLLLAARLSASGNQQGDVFHARLLEPIWLGEHLVLPEGSLFEGQVARRKPPRRFSRGGSLRLTFERLILPAGEPVAIPASLSAAEADHKSVWMDSEGEVHGGSRTKKRAALDLGLAYLTGKIADDLLEEGLKMGLGPAVSGSAAVAARYVGLGVGLAVFFGQRGKDVHLPQYTELELTFRRDVVLTPADKAENLSPSNENRRLE